MSRISCPYQTIARLKHCTHTKHEIHLVTFYAISTRIFAISDLVLLKKIIGCNYIIQWNFRWGNPFNWKSSTTILLVTLKTFVSFFQAKRAKEKWLNWTLVYWKPYGNLSVKKFSALLIESVVRSKVILWTFCRLCVLSFLRFSHYSDWIHWLWSLPLSSDGNILNK